MNVRIKLLVALSISILTTVGCKDANPSPPPVPTGQAMALASAALGAAQRPSAAVTKVIFVDKEQACKCTQKRIDDGWTALQAALGGHQTPTTIERLHADTQSAATEPYTKLRSAMVLPALYFMDAEGGLAELLQGEVTQEQIHAVLAGGTGKH